MHTAHLLSITVCDMSPGTVTETAAHSAVTKFGISGKGAELESNPKQGRSQGVAHGARAHPPVSLEGAPRAPRHGRDEGFAGAEGACKYFYTAIMQFKKA